MRLQQTELDKSEWVSYCCCCVPARNSPIREVSLRCCSARKHTPWEHKNTKKIATLEDIHLVHLTQTAEASY